MRKLIPFSFVLFSVFGVQAQNIQFFIEHATCGDATGSIIASVFGGSAPYTFLWQPVPPAGQGTTSITGVFPGVYSLTVTDSNGNDTTVTAEVLSTLDLFPPIVPTTPVWSCDAGCNGTYFQNVPLSGSPMPYTLVFDPPGPTGNATPNGLFFGGLCPGTQYMVTITNTNGCSGMVGPLDVIGSASPDILESTIEGSCPGGATGSMSLLFDQLDSIWVTGPDGAWLNFPTTNPYMATNLAPGTYSVGGYNEQGIGGGISNTFCDFSVTIVIPVSSEPCGVLSGVVHADLDEDCDQAPPDLGIPYRVLNIAPGDHFVLTNANGAYSTELFYDSYSLDASLVGYASSCTPLPAAFLLSASTPSAVVDLPMEVLFGADARAFVQAGVHRVGFPVAYTVSIHNEGPFSFNDLTLDLNFNPVLNFVSAAGSPTVVGPGQLRWDLAVLPGFSSESYVVEFTVPANTALLGVTLTGTATVITQTPDSDISNDSYTIQRTVIGAYDPNDKLALTDVSQSSELFLIDQDNHVDYTIRFQNTGTAEAINVFLIDTIAEDFDLASLRILGASHPFEVSLLPSRVLRFDFPNIMLPDSTSDLLGSQGFASFRLVPWPVLENGDHLLNAADIYFDFNEPIRTNTSDLVAEFSVGIAEGSNEESLVYPNPVRDVLMAQVPNATWNFTVISMDGRITAQGQQSGMLLTLDAAELAPGAYILRLVDTNSRVLVNRFTKD